MDSLWKHSHSPTVAYRPIRFDQSTAQSITRRPYCRAVENSQSRITPLPMPLKHSYRSRSSYSFGIPARLSTLAYPSNANHRLSAQPNSPRSRRSAGGVIATQGLLIRYNSRPELPQQATCFALAMRSSADRHQARTPTFSTTINGPDSLIRIRQQGLCSLM